MSTATRVPLGEKLRKHVATRATKLQSDYRENHSFAVSELALLRRGVSQPLGQDARLVGLTISGLDDHPERLPDTPQLHEKAAFAALTLFALHQQSHRDRDMHRSGYSFGRSARLLGDKTNAPDAVRARFTALATATSWQETLHHARGLVTQFRAQPIPLDYGRFARDLYYLQFPRYADRVRLAWGRDFYRVGAIEDAGDGAGASAPLPEDANTTTNSPNASSEETP